MSSLINLNGIGAVKHALFVRLSLPNPSATPPGSENEYLRISTFEIPYEIVESDNEAYTYSAAGLLLGVTSFQNEIKPSSNDVNIALSGIDDTMVSQALQYPVKGADVEIRRGFFDPNTNQILNIAGQDQVALRYKGVVNNYSYNENWNDLTQTVTWTVTLSCASIITVLANKVTGRLTNASSWQYWSTAPTNRGGFDAAQADTSMDRVSAIATTHWDFGGEPKVTPGSGSTNSYQANEYNPAP